MVSDTNRLGIHNITFEHFIIKPFTGIPAWLMPTIVVLQRVGTSVFDFLFFAKINKSKFQGMTVSYFFIFCVVIVLIIRGDTELNPGPKK